MNPIPFSKLSGSGNDFILIDNREQALIADESIDLVRKVCRRALSVGADGVILIEHDPQGLCDFAWRFFNADGSEAEMCGNGGRCAARFAHARGIAGKTLRFRTLAGVIRAEITGERTVKLQLTPPHGYEPKVELAIGGRSLCVKFLDTGVPHAVLEVDNVEKIDPAILGPEIRFHQRFAPQGANANFVHVAGEHSLFIRTYERGVEGETLACGTGSVAAAVTMALAGRVRPPVLLTTRSGEILTVHFDLDDGVPKDVFFEGAVKWVYDGTLLPESLL